MSPAPLDRPLTPAELEVLAGILLAAVLIGWALVWALLRAARLPAPAMLTVALSTLTLVGLFGAIITGSAALETVTATGLGALAAAVSHTFTHPGDRDDGDGDGEG